MSPGAGRRPLLFINQHYSPDVAATGQILTDLAEYLAAEGCTVTVLCARGGRGSSQLALPAREVRGGVLIRRYWTPGTGRRRQLGRISDYFIFTLQVAARLLFGTRPGAIITLTTPPLLPALTALVKRLRGVPYAVWSMDLHPEAEVAAGMLKREGVLARILFTLADDGYRQADFVVVLGECMRRLVLIKGVAPERACLVHVWTGDEGADPVLRKDDRLAAQVGVTSADFIVMYSGNAGLAHVFDPFLEAARRLERDGDIRFLFVGDGPRRPEIEAFVQEHRLTRVTYRDYFPRDRLAESISLGDTHLVSLRPEFEGIAVPAKLYGIMAAGRPVLFLGPRGCETARTVLEMECGFVVDPRFETDPAGRVAEILRSLRDDPVLRTRLGSRGRAAFLERYERSFCCAAFEQALLGYWPIQLGQGRPAEAGRFPEEL